MYDIGKGRWQADRMHVRPEDLRRLRAASASERRALLVAGSGLPGRCADLSLAQAAAEVVDVDEARGWLHDEDELLALCGALALASRDAPEARAAAQDPRRRVREGVALGLQVLGERDPMRLSEVLDGWRDDLDPLVQRARVAAICDPLLLKDGALAALALEVCAEATAALRAAADRRADGVRVLRQALGHAWSMAVAADPVRGLPAFRALEDDADPDVAWIVHANRGEAGLARLLAPPA